MRIGRVLLIEIDFKKPVVLLASEILISVVFDNQYGSPTFELFMI